MRTISKSTPLKVSNDVSRMPNISCIVDDHSNRVDHFLSETFSSAEITREMCPVKKRKNNETWPSQVSSGRDTMVSFEVELPRRMTSLEDTSLNNIETYKLSQTSGLNQTPTLLRQVRAAGFQARRTQSNDSANTEFCQRLHKRLIICTLCLIIVVVMAVLLVIQSRQLTEKEELITQTSKLNEGLRNDVKRLLAERQSYVQLDTQQLIAKHDLGLHD